MIGDYQGGDEKLFNEALEALDMLNSCLSEEATGQGAPPAAAPPAASPAPGLAPPPGAAAPRPADEAPLISFD